MNLSKHTHAAITSPGPTWNSWASKIQIY